MKKLSDSFSEEERKKFQLFKEMVYDVMVESTLLLDYLETLDSGNGTSDEWVEATYTAARFEEACRRVVQESEKNKS